MSPRYEQLKSRARQMRKNTTFEERLLWSRLRKKQLGGVKFRRQHILKPNIVDFYAASKKLVVEIDGSRTAVCSPSVAFPWRGCSVVT